MVTALDVATRGYLSGSVLAFATRGYLSDAAVELVLSLLGTAQTAYGPLESVKSASLTGTAVFGAVPVVSKDLVSALQGAGRADPVLLVEKLLDATATGSGAFALSGVEVQKLLGTLALIGTGTADLGSVYAEKLLGTRLTGEAYADAALEVQKLLTSAMTGTSTTDGLLFVVIRRPLEGLTVTVYRQKELEVER